MNSPKRNAVLALLARGLVTQGEAAMLARVSRSNIAYWVKMANINPVSLRKQRIVREYTAALFGKDMEPG